MERGKGTALWAAGGDVCQEGVFQGEEWRCDVMSHQGILCGLLGSLGQLQACESGVAVLILRARVGSAADRSMGVREVGRVTGPHQLLSGDCVPGHCGWEC